ncbi:hypothetical protein MITS9509_01832 [Synechococcus sp. MIT S9509]|uniref:hypothetical protein n=1 Tax=unclassified Synechococcus TaxID=2626047 RepID=UPI0007BB2EB3|nr:MULTISPECIES: hypothetical protein [unclassified Synechococcus]KZR85847.1 hypothetical protein MITS9504_01630 [Synechococcus sp. MIT S9504]KZR91911.1 hypothetical protein MITS9509_01832 [Synechococcus sp. MIT S9509]
MDDSNKNKQLEVFEAQLLDLLPEEQRQHVLQVEELMELAGSASTERELERYLDAEVIIESLEESSSELHGFLRGIEAAIHARKDQLDEPFRDEFLIRQFMKLPLTVQHSVADSFWQVDASIAQILSRVMSLTEQEKSALTIWLDNAEKLSD